MSNTFSPNGFSPVRRQDGAAPTYNQTPYKIAQANTHKFYKGDPVIRLNTGYIDVNTSLPTQGVLGIFMGCKYLSVSQGKVVWSPTFQGADAAGDVEAYVIDDPNVVMRVWVGTGSSSVAGGPVTLNDIGNTITFEYGTGNAASGISGAYVDYALKDVTSTLPFTIVGLVQDPPGVNGTDITSAGNLIEVTFNQQAFRVGATGV